MASEGFGSRRTARTSVLAALAFALIAALAASVAIAAPGGNSAATVTGEFADSCRDFTAHSSKDISHVEIRHADGRVVKDETIATPDYSIDGGAGDEIDSVDVKSGTTTETFACTAPSSPPTAVLERRANEHDAVLPPGTWTTADCVGLPTNGCDIGGHPRTYTFRGTSSTDPDDDIVGWSIDFGDGTSSSGLWATNPPSEVTHTYADTLSCICAVTLTVTDAGGNSATDELIIGFDQDSED